MNRVEIKELAKQKIKGNLWNILWPALVIGVVTSIVSSIFGPKIDYTNIKSLTEINVPTSYYFVSIIEGIVSGLLTAGYVKYLLNFTRTGSFNTSDIIDTVKAKWAQILIADILVAIVVSIGYVLFVIPGIILTFAYAMVSYIVIDTDTAGSDSLKKSREMMKGYKLDYFVFGLSFFGWILLVPFTLGLLLIWLAPYMSIASCIYYDRLSSLNNKKANSEIKEAE